MKHKHLYFSSFLLLTLFLFGCEVQDNQNVISEVEYEEPQLSEAEKAVKYKEFVKEVATKLDDYGIYSYNLFELIEYATQTKDKELLNTICHVNIPPEEGGSYEYNLKAFYHEFSQYKDVPDAELALHKEILEATQRLMHITKSYMEIYAADYKSIKKHESEISHWTNGLKKTLQSALDDGN